MDTGVGRTRAGGFSPAASPTSRGAHDREVRPRALLTVQLLEGFATRPTMVERTPSRALGVRRKQRAILPADALSAFAAARGEEVACPPNVTLPVSIVTRSVTGRCNARPMPNEGPALSGPAASHRPCVRTALGCPSRAVFLFQNVTEIHRPRMQPYRGSSSNSSSSFCLRSASLPVAPTARTQAST
jgi:hypothetical protein